MIDKNTSGGARSCSLRRGRADAEAPDGRLRAFPQTDLPRQQLRDARVRVGGAGHDDLLPLYLQNSFGFSPAQAGVRMLPFALPLFFFPRIAAALAAKLSGRTLLTIGLIIVVAGNLLTAIVVAAQLSFLVVAIGMVVTGCGAGLLNGETAKVSMSVIPPERGGMASGIGGTLRFVGLVTGITKIQTAYLTSPSSMNRRSEVVRVGSVRVLLKAAVWSPACEFLRLRLRKVLDSMQTDVPRVASHISPAPTAAAKMRRSPLHATRGVKF
jgi:MFS family permease